MVTVIGDMYLLCKLNVSTSLGSVNTALQDFLDCVILIRHTTLDNYMSYLLEPNLVRRHFAGVVNGIACYMQIKRLGFARECSNRSGDEFLFHFCSRD